MLSFHSKLKMSRETNLNLFCQRGCFIGLLSPKCTGRHPSYLCRLYTRRICSRMSEEDIYHQVLFEKQSAQTRNNFDWNIPLIVFAAVLVFQLLVGG